MDAAGDAAAAAGNSNEEVTVNEPLLQPQGIILVGWPEGGKPLRMSAE